MVHLGARAGAGDHPAYGNLPARSSPGYRPVNGAVNLAGGWAVSLNHLQLRRCVS